MPFSLSATRSEAIAYETTARAAIAIAAKTVMTTAAATVTAMNECT